jgi:hypothetical protein
MENWCDCTKFISESKNFLSLGEIVHGEHFSLNSTMTANEIMDPKMDPSFDGLKILDVETRLETDENYKNIFLNPIPTKKILQIINLIFQAEGKKKKIKNKKKN